jgi:hypothetical protein
MGSDEASAKTVAVRKTSWNYDSIIMSDIIFLVPN